MDLECILDSASGIWNCWKCTIHSGAEETSAVAHAAYHVSYGLSCGGPSGTMDWVGWLVAVNNIWLRPYGIKWRGSLCNRPFAVFIPLPISSYRDSNIPTTVDQYRFATEGKGLELIFLSLTVMTIVLILLNIPVFFLCMDFNSTVLGDLIVWTDFTVRFLLPFLIILTSSAVIIMKLRASSRFRREHVASDETRTERNDRKVTIMLLTLCLLYVLCISPHAVLHLFYRDLYWTPILAFVTDCALALMYPNHVINFIVYFFAAPNFRKELQRTFTTQSW